MKTPFAVHLIKSFLEERCQAVSLNEETSRLLPVVKGVPQGSVMRPLLFWLYINDLPHVLQHSQVHLYADDVQLYLSYPRNDITNGAFKINNDLDKIYNWTSGKSFDPLF